MAKSAREKIRLVSTGVNAEGKPTKFYYTTDKNKKGEGGKNKLIKKKFDPRAFNKATGKLGAHVEFKEEKMK